MGGSKIAIPTFHPVERSKTVRKSKIGIFFYVIFTKNCFSQTFPKCSKLPKLLKKTIFGDFRRCYGRFPALHEKNDQNLMVLVKNTVFCQISPFFFTLRTRNKKKNVIFHLFAPFLPPC